MIVDGVNVNVAVGGVGDVAVVDVAADVVVVAVVDDD